MDANTNTTDTIDLASAEAGLAATASPRARARVRRAMAMAAIAAVLALGGAFGLRPRLAEATPKSLPRAAAPATSPGATADGAPAAAPEGGGGAADDSERSGPDDDGAGATRGGKRVTGRLNLNTATASELMLLPGVGPAKAERVLAWRKRNGTFRRIADLRRVKGFGYKTLKRLEPFLDVKGDSTLRAAS